MSHCFCDSTENELGGFYKPGDTYPHTKKMEVVTTFFDLWAQSFPNRPSISSVSRAAKVSRGTVRKFITEFEETSEIKDPDEEKVAKIQQGQEKARVSNKLTPQEEIFLLVLRSKDPTWPNYLYTPGVGLLRLSAVTIAASMVGST